MEFSLSDASGPREEPEPAPEPGTDIESVIGTSASISAAFSD